MSYLITEAPLTREEEAALLPRAQAGDVVARNRLVTGNWRRILQIATQYCGLIEPEDAAHELVVELLTKQIDAHREGTGRLLAFGLLNLRRRLYEKSRRAMPLYVPEKAYRRGHRANRASEKTLLLVCDRHLSPEDEAIVKETTASPAREVMSPRSRSRTATRRRQAVLSLSLDRFADCDFWRADQFESRSRSYHSSNSASDL